MVKFVEQEFTSAHKFLNALRLSNPEWRTYHTVAKSPDQDWQRDWIFRGQGSDWPLLPTAWRSEHLADDQPLGRVKSEMGNREDVRTAIHEKISKLKYLTPFNLPAPMDHDLARQRTGALALQAFTELQLIYQFEVLADEMGFEVAHLPKWTRTEKFVSEYVDMVFPPLSVIFDKEPEDQLAFVSRYEIDNWIWLNPAVALAQHHGIPTRLLDWTRNPLAAAFFAAKQVKDVHGNDRLVVYALHKHMLQAHIKLIEVSSSGNDFLRAQSGVFTLDAKGDEFYRHYGNYLSLNESVNYIGALFNPIVEPQKLTLPVSQAPELLRLLWLERVTQAHLMPTLDHVAQAVGTKARLSGNTIIENFHDQI